ncbi:hypothetical protein C6P45_003550 [Maudiozyma exigua]|uniref:Uncharacterized protein n=1 Tax=Maudiozyma exigua TaxID=34358 RepID=A0A9P6VU94_MAUEX|nr:hypothetical protein C6P45_003550 [Kazachstania exigua]
MEKLSSLESSLPPEQPPTKQAVDSLKNELSQEFKLAANAVTKLYRVANEKNSLVKHLGYIECIDDLLTGIDNSDFQSVDDIRLWCSRQKLDRIGTKDTSNKKELDKKSNNFNFNFAEKKTINSPKFRLSMPPLSVEHTKPAIDNGRYKMRLKDQPSCSNPNVRYDTDSTNGVSSDIMVFDNDIKYEDESSLETVDIDTRTDDLEDKIVKKIKLNTDANTKE